MSDFFFLVIAACFVGAFVQSFFNHSRESQRRVFWSCAVAAASAGFLSANPDWKKGLEFALFVLGVMTLIAYAYTPYIKVGGKIYALTVQDSRPDPDDQTSSEATAARDPEYDPAPDAYSGMLTATKMWWMITGLMVIIAVNAYAYFTGSGEFWVAVGGLAFLAFLAVTLGYGDASWGYRTARGQYVQFVVATVLTAGAFGVVYFAAYQTARRWPLRRKQSMEYRTHPRHRRLE